MPLILRYLQFFENLIKINLTMRNEKGEIGVFFFNNVGENISSAMRDLCMDTVSSLCSYISLGAEKGYRKIYQ